VFAIPAIVFALKMNTAHKQGKMKKYQKAKKLSLIWLIVAVCLGIISTILYFLLLAPLI